MDETPKVIVLANSRTHPKPTADPGPLLLRATEVARLLGVGRTTVHELVAAGELPCVRIGRAVRIPREGLDRWIERKLSA